MLRVVFKYWNSTLLQQSFLMKVYFTFQEYNEFTKRSSTSSRHEQGQASYPATQNHVEDHTDYSHQNEM